MTDDLTYQRFVKFPLEGYSKNMKGLQTSWCVAVFPNMSRNFLKTWDEMCLGSKGMMEETSYQRTRWQPNHPNVIPPASTSSSSEKKSSTRWVVGPKCSEKIDQEKGKSMWVFPKIGVPQNGWFIMEHPMKMDDLGVPPFKETSMYRYSKLHWSKVEKFAIIVRLTLSQLND